MGRCILGVIVAASVLVALTATAAIAEDMPWSGEFLSREARTLRDESAAFVTAPFRVDNGALWGTLAVAGAVGVLSQFDEDIRDEVAETRGRTLDRITDAGSLVGNPVIHLGVAGAVYGGGLLAGSPRWRDTGLMMGEAALLADASTLVLKQAIGRARPLTGKGGGSFRPFGFESDYDSMPSMHTASSFAMASVITSTSGSVPVGVVSYATAAFVGFSRMQEGKHWASDVLLGAAIGELAGRIVTRFHAGGGNLALVPAVAEDAAILSLVGKF